MAKFIELKDKDGKAILVNADRISSARQADVEETGIFIVVDGQESFYPSENLCELKKKLSDDVSERIASNLFHIWEILRARLH